MAKQREEDQELVDQGLAALAEPNGADQADLAERRRVLAEIAARIEKPGLQDKILDRYQSLGRTLLADNLPGRVDPNIARVLRPMLGDVSDVRVHTGKMASEAASAMQARAFAVGDRDIFINRQEFDPTSTEGASLLAHEIAHTRDAATGFALSAKHGSTTSAREAFAEDVEMRFAREVASAEAGDDGEVDAATAPSDGKDAAAKPPEVDKELLARKILAVLDRQQLLGRERHGRP